MKIKGRYCYTPAAGKIHRNPPSLIERIRKSIRRRQSMDVFPIVDYWPAVYPAKK